ncbi:hypothetical protein [Stanieria cyanosphaera]|nr:hypothetical protein [Stanieria cyanosphaera]
MCIVPPAYFPFPSGGAVACDACPRRIAFRLHTPRLSAFSQPIN